MKINGMDTNKLYLVKWLHPISNTESKWVAQFVNFVFDATDPDFDGIALFQCLLYSHNDGKWVMSNKEHPVGFGRGRYTATVIDEL